MTTTTTPAPAKAWYLSKTFWLNLAALASMMFPAVREWLAANPVEFSAALGALNLLLRFATRERLTIFSQEEGMDGDRGGSGWGPGAVVLLLTATLFLLPSCSVIGSAMTGTPIPSTGVQRAGAKDATVIQVATLDLLQAEERERVAEEGGPLANPTVWGLYDAGRAADAVREVFSDSGK